MDFLNTNSNTQNKEKWEQIIYNGILPINPMHAVHFNGYPVMYFVVMFGCLSVIALGAVSIRKTVLPGMAIPMLKLRRPNGRLIFNMEIAIRR